MLKQQNLHLLYHVPITISHEIPEYGKTGLVMKSTNKIDKMKL